MYPLHAALMTEKSVLPNGATVKRQYVGVVYAWRSKYRPKKDEGQPAWRRRKKRAEAVA